jgi:sodium-dependent phosphate transporter
MTLPYTPSPSTRNTISPETRVLHSSHFYLPRNRSSFFSNESSLLKKESLPFKPREKRSTKSFLPILRLKNSKLTHPFASISSFAEAGGEEEGNEGIQIKKHQETVKNKEDDSPGMARAFDISSSTASAISIVIAFAALSLPFCLKTLGQGLDLKTKFLSYVTLLFGFYMAWNIGANDVANAMGTSVGSGALTMRQAVLTAAVLEFSGALLMGTHVTSTMQKGILVANVFQGKDTLLFAGLLSSLAAAGTWLQVHFAYKHLLPFNSFRYITFCMRFEFIRGIYDIIQSRSYVFRS